MALTRRKSKAREAEIQHRDKAQLLNAPSVPASSAWKHPGLFSE